MDRRAASPSAGTENRATLGPPRRGTRTTGPLDRSMTEGDRGT